MSGRKANGMPDFHSILGGAGGSYTSDESMAAMNSRQADPTSKDDDRRNVVLDLAGDEGSVDDLKLKEVGKSDGPFVAAATAPLTFGTLYKRDGRAGRDADGDGKTNERGNPTGGVGRAIRNAVARTELRINDAYRNIRGIGLRPREVDHRNQADIRRGLHRHGRTNYSEKMIARNLDGRVFFQPGETSRVSLSPQDNRVKHTYSQSRTTI
jgi:hypothetical protein